MDPYHIMERRGRLCGSMWLGLGGLRWLVNVILKLRNWNGTLAGFFEFLRDGYRVIEISCLSDYGGRFLDVSEYHSGAHRGNIRIPKGRRGAGRSLFEFQVRKFFLYEIAIPEQSGRIPRGTAGEGKLMAGIREDCNGSRFQTRQSCKSWVNDSARFAPWPKTVTGSDGEKREFRQRVLMDSKAPRPTRLSHFIWKPISKTLRITLTAGSRKVVKWIGPDSYNGPKIIKENVKASNGPLPTHNNSEAQQAETKNKGSLVQPFGAKSNLGSHYFMGEASGTTGMIPSQRAGSSPSRRTSLIWNNQESLRRWSLLGARMESVVGNLMATAMTVRSETRLRCYLKRCFRWS